MEITKEEYNKAKKVLDEAYMYGEPSGDGGVCYENGLTHAREIVEEYEKEDEEGCSEMEGSFMWAVYQMHKMKKVRRKTHPEEIIFSNPQCNCLYYHNHPQKSFGYSGCIIDFEAMDWEIFEENELIDDSVEELIYQAHMLGQTSVGCTHAGYSNARADCNKIVKELKNRDIN